MEAYMDNTVVKTKDKATLVQDLEEIFANLRKINLKLNPEKCVFGVLSGKLLGSLCRSAGLRQTQTRLGLSNRLRHPDGSRTCVGSLVVLPP